MPTSKFIFSRMLRPFSFPFRSKLLAYVDYSILLISMQA